MLDIQLLGGFRLVYDDKPLTDFDSPRLQSLIAYLILHPDAPQSRQHIAFLFWPDSTEAQARTNLRGLLHRIRQALPSAGDFIASDQSTIHWLQDAPYRVDMLEFERSLDEAQSLPALREAVDLYRGELLPGLYDAWVLAERERLAQLLQEALKQLTDLLKDERSYRSAISYAKRLVLQDPLREEYHRQLIRLYALVGDKASAVRVYQTCVQVLRRELGVAVSPATRQAYEQVLKSVEAFEPSGRAVVQPRKDNLPTQLTSFIGRERQVEEVMKQLQNARLLTLTGSGGSGKTRLGLRVAADRLSEMKDGIWLVELASLSDSALVLDAIAAVLGVREERDLPLLQALMDYLQPKQLLLILDNCEHLLPDCARLADSLLRSNPSLRILATSRERLNVPSEVVWQVPSLNLPNLGASVPAELMKSEAIHLFVERAASVMQTFSLNQTNAASVVQICRRLDGIPLAIELAAARIRMFTPQEIATRLDDTFGLLTGGSTVAPSRHQTLSAAIDWSYVLLTPKEQTLFRRLTVFAGGFSLHAVEKVAPDLDPVVSKDGSAASSSEEFYPENVLEILSNLIDKSLVLAEGHERVVRYSMLNTIRQYAHEKLHEAGERRALRHRHFHFFRDLAEEAAQKLRGPEQIRWLNHLESELGNLRAALGWALEQEDAELGLRLALFLEGFWSRRERLSEGREWIEGALSFAKEDGRMLLHAKGRNSLAWLIYQQGDYATSLRLAQESQKLLSELGRHRGHRRRTSLSGVDRLASE